MSTGGLSLLLATQVQPHTFTGLQTIGKVVYIFDLIIFTLITMAITYRFVRFRGTFTNSIVHPSEGLMVPTAFLSLASIIAAIARYGIPSCGEWLVTTYRVLFWIYFAVTFCTAVGHYFLLFTSPLLKIEEYVLSHPIPPHFNHHPPDLPIFSMTPAWDLPIFPFMLSGTIAATGSPFQPASQAVSMILAGLTAQGLGMLISILMYASYIRRMINFGFPSPNSRPAMFIAAGPPSFTSLALIGMANDFPTEHYVFFGDAEITSQILRVMATMTAVFIWSLAFWFFCLAVLACLVAHMQMSFHLNWWAFVFPNVGFTIATINIGKQFRSQGVLWVGSVMTVLLVITYISVGVCHVRAVLRKDILWEGKDEDFHRKEAKVKHEDAEKMGNV